MVGVHRQTIYQYEKGLIDPSLEVFVAICRVFEVMPEQLLDVMDLSGSDIKRFKARCEEEGLSTYEAIRLFIQTY